MAPAKDPGLKGGKMAINREKDHKGQKRIVVSKYWPDASRFRRYFPNVTVARKTMARIEESIAMGTWRRLKEELARGVEQGITVSEFSKIYLRDYCQTHNTRPDFKEQALTSITRILGETPVKDLRRSHAHQFIAKRSREVASATVNRGLAVLKNMLTFAVEREYIEAHPLLRFRMLPEEQKALRVITLEEERRLVEAVAEVDPTIGAYVAVLGETGLRKSEGLNLKWVNVNVQERILAVENTKSGKPRYIPLSDFALQWLNSLVRVIGCTARAQSHPRTHGSRRPPYPPSNRCRSSRSRASHHERGRLRRPNSSYRARCVLRSHRPTSADSRGTAPSP